MKRLIECTILLLLSTVSMAHAQATTTAPLQEAAGVWFNDVREALPLSEEQGHRLCLDTWQQLRSGKAPEPDFATNLPVDNAPRILFLTLDDGTRFPMVISGGGQGVRAALLACVRQAQSRFDGRKLVTMRLELVQQTMPTEQFVLRTTPFAKPGLLGLALSPEYPVAITADLLASGNCFTPKNVLISGKVEEQFQRAQISLKTGFFWNRAVLSGQPLTIWYFETLAWHTDGKDVSLLFQNHAMPQPATALRLLQDGAWLAAFLAGRLQGEEFTGQSLLNWPAPPFNRESVADSALAAWSLLEWQGRHPAPKMLNPLRGALGKWLKERTRITPDNPACRQVMEENGLSPLDANSFLALALCRYREVAKEPKAWNTELNQIANYLCAQLLDNGAVISSRDLSNGAPGLTQSLHGPGIAALALAQLHGNVTRTDCLERAEKVVMYQAKNILKGDEPVEPWSNLAFRAIAAKKAAATASFAPIVARLDMRLADGQTGTGLFPDFLGGWYDSPDLRVGALHTLGLLQGAQLLRDAGMNELADRQLADAHMGLLYTLQGQNDPIRTQYSSFTYLGGSFQRWLTAPTLSLEMQGLALLMLGAADEAAAHCPGGALPLTAEWNKRLAMHRQQVLLFPRCLPPRTERRAP